MNKLTWTVTVEEDPVTGEIILPIPKEVIDLQGWVDGEELDVIDNGDGSWTIQTVQQ